jgi:uncharacterized phiE125 gp8 family phage protein
MFSAVQVAVPPAGEPVSVDLARLHLRVDQYSDDALIETYITAARTWAEMFLGRALLTQQLAWTLSQDQPPNGAPYLSMPLSLLVLPMWFQWPQPVISVDQVSYGQWGQTDTVLTAGTDYDADITSARLRIHPGAEVLPNDHLQVLFTAGYGVGAASVPGPILTAILVLTAFLYENRGDTPAEMPTAATMLLTPYRIVRFG